MDIIWGDELKTGIPLIDDQHKFIVEALSGLRISKLKGAELFQLLSDLQTYLSSHFELEEKYMKETNYPEYTIHKADHDKVLEDCKNILTQNDKDYSPREVALELIKYMKNWFIDHYSNVDVKMAEYLKQHLNEIN